MLNQCLRLPLAECSREEYKVKGLCLVRLSFLLVLDGTQLVRAFHGFHGGDVLVHLLDGHGRSALYRCDGCSVELEWFINHIDELSGFNPPSKKGASLPLEYVDLSSATCLDHFP